MRILALDATHGTFSVALIEDRALIAEMTMRLPRQVSTQLVPTIELLLNKVGWSLESLTLIATSHGPGSYTGLRLAVTTAKALAYGLDVPLVGISSLKLLAQAVPPLPIDAYLVPLIDARGERAYGAVYRWALEGQSWFLRTIIDERVQTIDAWLKTLQTLLNGSDMPLDTDDHLDDHLSMVVLIGDPSVPYKDIWRAQLGEKAHWIEGVYAPLRAAHLAQLAIEAWQDGAVADAFFVPLYVQKSAPEKNLEQS